MLHPISLFPIKGEEVYDCDSLRRTISLGNINAYDRREEFYLFSADYLKDFAAKVFMHFGISEADASRLPKFWPSRT